MKSFSKRMLSFSMAAAMVLSTAVISPVDAQAATKKPAMTASTSKIAAGKTYSVKVKNLTKKQYIKFTKVTAGETVKFGSKKIKKGTKINGTGKTLTIKVKTTDKIKNYKSVLKAQAYVKKTNKKVGKTLSTSRTVKCTTLAVNDVTVASTRGKYLVATFSKSLDKLSIADIEIRNKETNELKGVEKVDLASDGKSATITLVGAEEAGNRFIDPNVDYTFKVSQSGVSATTVFKIDAVASRASVISVDKTNRKIKVVNAEEVTTGIYDSADEFIIPTSLGYDDFDKLIGSTVTVWYNKNNEATKMDVISEKTVISAFEIKNEGSISSSYMKDLATGDKYYFQADSGKLKNTRLVNIASAGYSSVGSIAVSSNMVNRNVAYAKLTLNASGTIKTVVATDGLPTFGQNKILVDKVVDTTVSAGTKKVVNLKDYLILENGSKVEIADLVGKLVFYDSAKKFAVAYNNTKTGALEAVYQGKFKFAGTIYDTNTANATDGSNGVLTPVSDSYMNKLLSGKEDVTVYFGLDGKPAYIAGTEGSVKTDVKAVVLTDSVKGYKDKLDHMIRIVGYENGKTACVKDVNVAKLTSVRTTGTAGNSSDSTEYKKDKDNVKGFIVDTPDTATFAAIGTDENGDAAIDHSVLTLANLSAGDVIYVTEDANGNVVGINAKANDGAVSGDFVAGKTAFEISGGKTYSYQIKAGVPVYFYDSAAKSVSATTYGEYTNKATGSNVSVYSANGTDIDCVVVTQTESAALTYKKVVISDSLRTTDDKLASLTVINGSDVLTFEKFKDTLKTVKPSNGDVYKIGIAADGVTIESLEVLSANATNVYVSANSVNVNTNSFATYELATAEGAVITVAVKDGTTYKTYNFSELDKLSASNKVDVYTMDGTKYVDTIVIKEK